MSHTQLVMCWVVLVVAWVIVLTGWFFTIRARRRSKRTHA